MFPRQILKAVEGEKRAGGGRGRGESGARGGSGRGGAGRGSERGGGTVKPLCLGAVLSLNQLLPSHIRTNAMDLRLRGQRPARVVLVRESHNIAWIGRTGRAFHRS